VPTNKCPEFQDIPDGGSQIRHLSAPFFWDFSSATIIAALDTNPSFSARFSSSFRRLEESFHIVVNPERKNA